MADNVRFNISPRVSSVDTPVTIRLEGLTKNPRVKISVRRPSTNPQITLESYGVFRSDETGNVEVDFQAPIEGTYSEVDGMGLFWSMQRIESTPPPTQGNRTHLSPLFYAFTAEQDGMVVAEATIERQWMSPDVRRVPVSENGLVATYFHHVDERPRPGIIVFGGSEGGLNEYVAALFASHGYATLALAYFCIENLPSQLVNIPLEYIESAIEWFSTQPGVDEGWIGVHGTSKGGELALLSASRFPSIKAVVCVSCGGVVYHGIQANGLDKLPPSWTYREQPIAYASPENPYRSGKLTPPSSNVIAYRDWYNFHLSDDAVVQEAMIPVEKIQGGILFVSGQDDAMLDSERTSEWSMDRLRKHKHPYSFKHLVYPAAGHAIGIPYLVASTRGVAANGKVWLLGGTLSATAHASIDSWSNILDFFGRESFRNQLGG